VPWDDAGNLSGFPVTFEADTPNRKRCNKWRWKERINDWKAEILKKYIICQIYKTYEFLKMQKLSAVIITYNAEIAYRPEWSYIIEYECCRWRLIVVDSFSTDSTEKGLQ